MTSRDWPIRLPRKKEEERKKERVKKGQLKEV
jgi:hypothetical protein